MISTDGKHFRIILDIKWVNETLETLIENMCWDLVDRGILSPEDCLGEQDGQD